MPRHPGANGLVFFAPGQLRITQTPEHLEAARHGYEFLRDRMWDRQFGGFYWEVDSSGRAATRPDKHTYGQAFGLYALTEYAVASGDSNAKATAKELFTLMETKAHDEEHGGYREILKRDWGPLPTRAASLTGMIPPPIKANEYAYPSDGSDNDISLP